MSEATKSYFQDLITQYIYSNDKIVNYKKSFLSLQLINLKKIIMMKKMFFVLFIAVVALSCNNGNNKGSNDGDADSIALISIENFEQEVEGKVGDEVQIEGTVVHVCKHGGKRMFIIGEDPDKRVKITAGDKVATFDVELEGTDVLVKGILNEERIDEKYLSEWEEEIKAGSSGEPEALHTGEPGHEDHEKEDDLKKIEKMRLEIQNSEKGYLSFYSIEALKVSKTSTK